MRQIILKRNEKTILMVEDEKIKYQIKYIYSDNKYEISRFEKTYIKKEDDEVLNDYNLIKEYFESTWKIPENIFKKCTKEINEETGYSVNKISEDTILIVDKCKKRKEEYDYKLTVSMFGWLEVFLAIA